MGQATTQPETKDIEGVKVIALEQFPDHRGTVQHMLRATDPHFESFGEIYFSSIYNGVVKAWKNHKRATANHVCVFGRVKFVLYDARDDSPTKGYCMEVFLGPEDYSLLVIPPGIWNGFQGLGDPLSIVASCPTEPYDPNEIDRVEPADPRIPYEWRH